MPLILASSKNYEASYQPCGGMEQQRSIVNQKK